jgi:pantothenate kinase
MLPEQPESDRSGTNLDLKVPGAGKSTFATELCQELAMNRGLRAQVVPMDGYHYERRVLDTFPDPSEAHRRRGAPFTFDALRFADELQRARKAVEEGKHKKVTVGFLLNGSGID